MDEVMCMLELLRIFLPIFVLIGAMIVAICVCRSVDKKRESAVADDSKTLKKKKIKILSILIWPILVVGLYLGFYMISFHFISFDYFWQKTWQRTWHPDPVTASVPFGYWTVSVSRVKTGDWFSPYDDLYFLWNGMCIRDHRNMYSLWLGPIPLAFQPDRSAVCAPRLLE